MRLWLEYSYLRARCKAASVRKKFTSIFPAFGSIWQHLAAFGSIWQHLAAKCAIRAPQAVAHGLDLGAANCCI